MGPAARRKIVVVISMIRRSPVRDGSFRSGSFAASAAVTNFTQTSRSSHSTLLAASSTWAICSAVSSLSRSIVEDDAPRWKLTVFAASFPLERGGQQVLTGVLLHVIEAALPIDVTAHPRILLELAIDEVADGAVLLLEHVETPSPRQACRYRMAGRRRLDRTPFGPA